MSEARPQRRLPTKTRSGIITLPTASNPQAIITDPAGLLASVAGLEDDDELLVLQQQQQQQQRALQASPRKQPEPDDEEELLLQQQQHASQARSPSPPLSVPGHGAPSPESASASQTSTQTAASPIQPEEEAVGRGPSSEPQPAASCSTSSEQGSKTAPSRASGSSRGKGGPSLTGPLNSSTAPTVVSLPVKRRGSYQNLKKQMQHGSEDTPGVLASLKKATHWEKFGTILVLYCAKDKEEHDELVQMMSVEGYDTEVVDNQLDALAYFKSREVFPDVVVVDTDHTYNTIQLIKQFQAQLPTVAIIIMGSATSRPNAVTALNAGAADYMRKPVDEDELVARIERHVQRQHCIKLELEKALEDVKLMMAQLKPAAQAMAQAQPANKAGKQGLGAVAETDFEEQMSELSEENQRLATRLQEMEARMASQERSYRQLQSKLRQLDPGAHANDSDGPASAEVD
uniref:Response regulatory domain-containing protein n=1 Tax=Chlamydomonas leiostraca TaxID=1034604 RepID=A0A7S0RU76_9CHLO|mmetsp:Transcript_31338/g.79949  ORF Transcript_31338/g.79949 Transcript_31338/m.79949 type:complete len:459 (+) Transcript_31338:159-1535(+)